MLLGRFLLLIRHLLMQKGQGKTVYLYNHPNIWLIVLPQGPQALLIRPLRRHLGQTKRALYRVFPAPHNPFIFEHSRNCRRDALPYTSRN
jgi:hypothetical protein